MLDHHFNTYDPAAKKRYHQQARNQLRKVAQAIGLSPDQYDLRSNKAGPACKGEVTLHTDKVYVQIGGMMGILIRSCNGRKDYSGGNNNFAKNEMIEDVPALAGMVRRIGGYDVR